MSNTYEATTIDTQDCWSTDKSTGVIQTQAVRTPNGSYRVNVCTLATKNNGEQTVRSAVNFDPTTVDAQRLAESILKAAAACQV